MPREVSKTVDWVVAEFTRLNTPRYFCSVERLGSKVKPVLEQYREDPASFEVLLSEDVGTLLRAEPQRRNKEVKTVVVSAVRLQWVVW